MIFSFAWFVSRHYPLRLTAPAWDCFDPGREATYPQERVVLPLFTEDTERRIGPHLP